MVVGFRVINKISMYNIIDCIEVDFLVLYNYTIILGRSQISSKYVYGVRWSIPKITITIFILLKIKKAHSYIS